MNLFKSHRKGNTKLQILVFDYVAFSFDFVAFWRFFHVFPLYLNYFARLIPKNSCCPAVTDFRIRRNRSADFRIRKPARVNILSNPHKQSVSTLPNPDEMTLYQIHPQCIPSYSSLSILDLTSTDKHPLLGTNHANMTHIKRIQKCTLTNLSYSTLFKLASH